MSPRDTLSAAEADDLMLRYLDGHLGPEEVARLDALLRADLASRDRMAQFLVLDVQLSEIFQEETHRCGAAAATRAGMRRSSWDKVSWLWQNPARLAALITVGVGTGLLLLLWTLAPAVPDNAVQITELDGTVLIRSRGREQSAGPGTVLKPGDWLVLGPDGAVTVGYRSECTRFRFNDAARVSIASSSRGKVVELQAGSMSATVAPQPARSPLRVQTPEAQATVVGTEFTVDAAERMTRLEVWGGQVELTHLTDGDFVTVSPGESATAVPGLPLHLEKTHGGVLREAWRGIAGTEVQDLTSDPRYPGDPSEVGYWSRLELCAPHGDSYGLRLRAWLHAPQPGEYRFWLAADDQAELWLSSDEKPERKRRICFARRFTGARDWDSSPEQQSDPVRLEPGRKYYLEVLMKQCGGEESLSVAWQGPKFPRQVIDGFNLTPVAR